MNASPSLDFDVMRATDMFGGPFTPAGLLLQDVHPAAARSGRCTRRCCATPPGSAGSPRASPSASGAPSTGAATRDVLVVGGGAAGLRAATAAAELGADVVLCDEGPEPGGGLLAEGGHERARELAERARAAGVEVLTSAPALGAFDGLVPVWQGDTLHQVRAARAVVRHRRDRAAAAVPRQRPARRDAVRRRAPAGRALRA